MVGEYIAVKREDLIIGQQAFIINKGGYIRPIYIRETHNPKIAGISYYIDSDIYGVSYDHIFFYKPNMNKKLREHKNNDIAKITDKTEEQKKIEKWNIHNSIMNLAKSFPKNNKK